MNLRYFFLVIFFTININGQHLKGYVVTNNNDTINCTFHHITNLFWKHIFNPATLRNNVKIINKEGQKIKYKPFELTTIIVKDVQNTSGFQHEKKDIKFVSIQADNYEHFYEEIFIGLISCYRLYDEASDARLLQKDVYVKNDNLFKIGFLSERSDAAALIIDNNSLHQKWINKEPYKLDQMNEVFQLYNNYNKSLIK